MGLLGAIAGLGATAVGIGQLLKKPKEPEGYGDYLAVAERQNEGQEYALELAKLMDPRSRGFEDLVTQEESRLQGNFAADLADLMRTNRRSQRLGWGPVLNPERRDETIAGAMAMGREQARSAARDNILRYLQGAAGTASGAASAPNPYSGPVNMSMNLQDRRQTGKMGGYEALFGGMRALDQQPSYMDMFNMRTGGQNPNITTQGKWVRAGNWG